MTDFPLSAQVDKIVPKKLLYGYLKPEQATDRFWVDDVERLKVSHNLTPANTRLKGTANFSELLVLRVDFKKRPECLQALAWLAAAIPHPLVMRCCFADEDRWAVCYRRMVDGKLGSGVLYCSAWQAQEMPELHGNSLEAVYLNLVGQLAGVISDTTVLTRSQLDDLLERQQALAGAEREISSLEKREKSAKQSHDKWELHQKKLEAERKRDELLSRDIAIK